jgi:hypothetical protein
MHEHDRTEYSRRSGGQAWPQRNARLAKELAAEGCHRGNRGQEDELAKLDADVEAGKRAEAMPAIEPHRTEGCGQPHAVQQAASEHQYDPPSAEAVQVEYRSAAHVLDTFRGPPRERAWSNECRHIARAIPRPVVLASVM